MTEVTINVDSCPQLNGRTGQHHFVWNGQTEVQCSQCGQCRENTRDSNRITQPGVIHEHPVQTTE